MAYYYLIIVLLLKRNGFSPNQSPQAECQNDKIRCMKFVFATHILSNVIFIMRTIYSHSFGKFDISAEALILSSTCTQNTLRWSKKICGISIQSCHCQFTHKKTTTHLFTHKLRIFILHFNLTHSFITFHTVAFFAAPTVACRFFLIHIVIDYF